MHHVSLLAASPSAAFNCAILAPCCTQGACSTCAASSATMKMGIERCLKAAFGGQLVEVLQVRGSWEEMVLAMVAISRCNFKVSQFVTRTGLAGCLIEVHHWRGARLQTCRSREGMEHRLCCLVRELSHPDCSFHCHRLVARKTTAPRLGVWTCTSTCCAALWQHTAAAWKLWAASRSAAGWGAVYEGALL